MNRRTLLGAGLTAPVLALSGCGVFSKSYNYRFRINLHSMIDGAERVGTSVLQGRWVDTLGFSPTARWQDSFWGDAIVIKPRETTTLVALLGTVQGHPGKSGYSGGGFTIPLGLFVQLSGTHNWANNGALIGAIPCILNVEKDVPRHFWPIMVYFPDFNRFQSASYEDADRLGAGFAEGSKITRFTISLTDDPITAGIGEKLPWLNEVGTFKTHRPVEQSLLPVYQQLERNNFRAEGRAI
jgi:hypothetical protein